jgi:CRP/FNR family cyclic AMP-dependent transcriptional regulator
MAGEDRKMFLDVLGAEERRKLLAQAHPVRAHKGQILSARGEAAADVYVVQEGRLDVVLYAADGREVSLRTLREGQLFGELAAIDDAVRSVSIIAATDARLLRLPQQAFRDALRNCPEASDWMLRRLTSQIRSLTDRVFELSALNVQARLHCELIRLAKSPGVADSVAPTHAELANRIGTHREAVTRELNALAARKVIRGGRRRLEFLDLDGLEREVRSSLRAAVGEEGWW